MRAVIKPIDGGFYLQIFNSDGKMEIMGFGLETFRIEQDKGALAFTHEADGVNLSIEAVAPHPFQPTGAGVETVLSASPAPLVDGDPGMNHHEEQA